MCVIEIRISNEPRNRENLFRWELFLVYILWARFLGYGMHISENRLTFAVKLSNAISCGHKLHTQHKNLELTTERAAIKMIARDVDMDMDTLHPRLRAATAELKSTRFCCCAVPPTTINEACMQRRNCCLAATSATATATAAAAQN